MKRVTDTQAQDLAWSRLKAGLGSSSRSFNIAKSRPFSSKAASVH
jgi:hypothetical protein